MNDELSLPITLQDPAKMNFAGKLRRRMTLAEARLWTMLRARRCGGYKFRRQVALGPYIADFCCIENKCIIEVDGSIHDDRKEYDRRRTKYLELAGFTVIRFSNTQVLECMGAVLREILLVIRQDGGRMH